MGQGDGVGPNAVTRPVFHRSIGDNFLTDANKRAVTQQCFVPEGKNQAIKESEKSHRCA